MRLVTSLRPVRRHVVGLTRREGHTSVGSAAARRPDRSLEEGLRSPAAEGSWHRFSCEAVSFHQRTLLAATIRLQFL